MQSANGGPSFRGLPATPGGEKLPLKPDDARVNLILFAASEIHQPLPRRDPRAIHLLDILRRKIGDSFDTGVIDGPRGKATITAVAEDAISLAFAWGAAPPPSDPIALIVGLPRPQTARDILRDATALGVGALHFVRTEKGEPSYAQSTLWSSGEWRRHVIAGAEQAFDTRLPEVTSGRTLAEVVATLPPAGTRLALDNYESTVALGGIQSVMHYVTLAIGAERGWSAAERGLLRQSGFVLARLGPRVLRTETAVIAALSITRVKLGLM